jgi:hypothetical protein
LPRKLGRVMLEREGILNMSAKLGRSVTTLALPSGFASSVMFFCGRNALNAAITSFLVKLLMRVVVRFSRREAGSGRPKPPSAQSHSVQSLPMYTPCSPEAGAPLASSVVSDGVASRQGAPMNFSDSG